MKIKIVTTVKYIYMYISQHTWLTKSSYQNNPQGLTQDSGHGILVQLVRVCEPHAIHDKFYCSVSFARQYRMVQWKCRL